MKRSTFSPVLKTMMLLGIGAAVFAGPARAEHIYVRNAAFNGDGSAARPFWNITSALARARSDRWGGKLPLTERIVIHVAAGAYMGSYDAPGPTTPPSEEVLPIVLNIPNLTLQGDTVLRVDSNGVPTDIMPGTQETVLHTDDGGGVFGSAIWSLLMIVRTLDGGAGDDVTVSGLTLDQPVEVAGLNGISVERVSGFAIRGNRIRNALSAIYTRLASGVIQGNLITDCVAAQTYVSGGSATYPAKVAVTGNRMTHDQVPSYYWAEIGLGTTPLVDVVPLNLGLTGLTVRPLEVNGGPDVPAGVDVAIIENDLSGNIVSGLDVALVTPFVTREEVQAAGTPVNNVVVLGNSMNSNENYGMVVDAGDPSRESPPWGFKANFRGIFSGNQFVGNSRGGAFFSFTSRWVVLAGNPPTEFDYLQQSSYQVIDLDRELMGFDYDNPLVDPVDGKALHNILSVNGAIVPYGTRITPPGP